MSIATLVHFCCADRAHSNQRCFRRWNAKASVGEFYVNEVLLAPIYHASPTSGKKYADIGLSMRIARDVTFYVNKIALPLWSILAFGCMSFAFEPDDLGSKMELVAGMFLTSFAIQWVVLDRLPRTPYLTAVDRLVTLSMGLLFLMALGGCIAFRVTMDYPDKEDLPRTIDKCTAGVILIIFLVFHLSLARDIVNGRVGSSGQNRKWNDIADGISFGYCAKGYSLLV
eukprot:m.485513 g.485513  ORF g.485513 m.485513 type:complete len:227 (+) comp21735_c0_seq26:144-824(+)